VGEDRFVILALRRATPDDFEQLYRIQSEAMRPHVEKTWGEWDEADQRATFSNTFDVRDFEVIVIDGEEAGFLETTRRPDDLFIRNIALDDRHRGRGLGTRILSDLVTRADRERLVLRLSVLKVNPATRLYLRLGFVVYGEDEHRLFFERHPQRFADASR
jgi:ribosomal protein S18 acetylase RimI-like enzyme